MTDFRETNRYQGVTDSAEASSMATASLGRCLADARKDRGLSITEVVQAIKFSPRQVEAIENDEFDKLPGATVVRGFIRSYAKLLRLDPVNLLAMFDKQVPPVTVIMEVPTDTGAALPQMGGHGSRPGRSLMLGGALAALLGAGAAYYFWPLTYSLPAASLASGPSNPDPVVAPSAERSLPQATGEPVNTPPVSEPVDFDMALQNAAEKGVGGTLIQGSALMDPELRQLAFVFDDKSWVEVKDATQHIIFAQNNLPGTRQVVSGKPPFAVVIGNASHVQLLYEERQVDLQPYTKVDVARFNLE